MDESLDPSQHGCSAAWVQAGWSCLACNGDLSHRGCKLAGVAWRARENQVSMGANWLELLGVQGRSQSAWVKAGWSCLACKGDPSQHECKLAGVAWRAREIPVIVGASWLELLGVQGRAQSAWVQIGWSCLVCKGEPNRHGCKSPNWLWSAAIPFCNRLHIRYKFNSFIHLKS